MTDSGTHFLKESARFLTTVYLPKIEQCVQSLSDDDLWWRPNEASNSIGNLLLHLSGNVRQWIISGLGGEPDKRIRRQEFDQRGALSKQELLTRLRETVTKAAEVISGLDPSTLEQRKTIQKTEVSVLYAIYHVVEHFSMHTGQIISMTKMRTGTDLKFYEISNGKPIERWKKA